MDRGPARNLHLLAPLVAVVALVPVAIWFHYPMDFGSAYHAGQVAWSTGHPEVVSTSWLGTPFYGLVMALVSRAQSLEVTTLIMLAGNLLVWGALLLSAWDRLHRWVSSRWWWSTLLAAAVFAPAVTSIFWMQVNLIVFAATLWGVALLGRRDRAAGTLIGLALAVKPIVVLLPIVLLMRRDSRRAGAWSIAVAALLTGIGLAFLAWRAGDPSVGSPIVYLAKFGAQSRGRANQCVIENYSPMALLCRLGVPASTVLTVVIALAVLGVACLLVRQFRHVPVARWELFAVASLLSPMVGPIGWAIYQLLLAPLMLLLAYQFATERAPVFLWVNLGFVYLLTMLIWDPLESYVRTPVPVLVVSYMLGQFAQYFLILLWVQWMRTGSAKATNVARFKVGAKPG